MFRIDFRLFTLVAVLLVSLALVPVQAQSTAAGGVTVAVTSSANPATFAAPVSFTVTVTSASAAGPVPTGTVIATVPGPYELGIVTLDGNGHGVIAVPEQTGLFANNSVGLASGSDNLTFSYSGDSKYAAAQSTFTEFINKANTGTAATVGASGQPGTLTATVTINQPTVTNLLFTLPGGVTSAPTGSVQFFNGTALLGTATLAPTGLFTSTATLAVVAIPANLTAVYSGDNNYNASTSTATGPGGGATVTLSATSSANPATFAEPVTLSVSVTASSAQIPTGTVSASLSGIFNLGTATVDATGRATLNIPSNTISASSTVPWGLPVGTDSITVSYSGDTHFAAAQTTVTQTVYKANTATVATLANTAGGGLSITATVNISQPSVTPIAFAIPGSNGGASPSGSIQFLNSGNPIGTATLSSSGQLQSSATLLLNPLASTANITAVYSGDGNYSGSTSPAATGTASNMATIGVTSSVNPSTFAQPVTFSVTVASPTAGGPVPTGTVTASVLGSDTLASATLNSAGSAFFTVPSQNPTANPALPWGLATGSNLITVAYSGDGNYTAGKSNFTQLVNQAASSTKLLPTAIGTGFTIEASVQINQNSVSQTNFGIPAGGNLTTNPSGIVIFFDGASQIGTATLSPGGLFQSTTLFKTSTAPASARAVYAGDTDYTGSSSSSITLGSAPVTVTLAASTNPVTYGQAFTVVATVASATASGPTPTGTLTFYDGSQNLGWIATLDSGGKGSLPVPIPLATAQVCTPACPSAEVEVLAAGSHILTVSYSGDTNYAPATPAVSVTETVTKASTTTSVSGVASGLLPGLPGDIVALVADAQPPSGGPYHFMLVGASGLTDGNPSGTVQFYAGSTSLGPGTLNPNPAGNVASDADISSTGASGTFSAVYPGDANFQASSSAGTAVISLTSTPNPSTVGQSVTLTATVSLANATGTVQFLDGNQVLGNGTLSNGVANLLVSFTASGAHSLTAVYVVPMTGLAVASPPDIQTVAVVTTQEALNLTASPGIAVFGQPITLTAQVSGTAAAPPTGLVVFMDGTNQVGSATISSSMATVTITLPVGLHQILARWSGDTNWQPATSPTVSLAVLRANSKTTLTISGATLKATVTAVKPGAGTPTGTVEFLDSINQSVLGTVSLNAGTATLVVSSASAINGVVRAVYDGDSNFDASNSSFSSGARPGPIR